MGTHAHTQHTCTHSHYKGDTRMTNRKLRLVVTLQVQEERACDWRGEWVSKTPVILYLLGSIVIRVFIPPTPKL